MFKPKLKNAFISMIVIMMGSFLTISMIAITKFNSQIAYTSERNLVEAQVYYNAYSAIQRGIYEIRQNKDYVGWDYFSLIGDINTDATKSNLYAKYEVKTGKTNNVYYYVITGYGYGKFKGTVLDTVLEAHMIVNYDADEYSYEIGKLIIK